MAKGYNQAFAGVTGKVGGLILTKRGEQSIMRRRTFENNSKTPAQMQVRANITALAHLWNTLTPLQMEAWATLGDQMSNPSGTKTLSNYQAFTSVNGLRLACGQPTVSAAPSAPSAPAPLPPLMLAIALTPDTPPLSLTITSVAYTGLVQVFATAPVSAGRNSFSHAAYKLLTTLPGLLAGGTSLSSVYTARFGLPAGGRRIALRFVPVSVAGFRGASINASGVVYDVRAAASVPSPSESASLESPLRKAA